MSDDVHEGDAQPNAGPTAGYLVWHLSMRWQAEFAGELRALALTPAELAILAHLHALAVDGTHPNQRQLATVSGLEPMYLSKLTRALAERRLLTRSASPDDSRAVQLAPTDEGIQLALAASRIAADLDRQRLAALGGTESRRVAQLKASLQLLLHDADARRHLRPTPTSSPRGVLHDTDHPSRPSGAAR